MLRFHRFHHTSTLRTVTLSLSLSLALVACATEEEAPPAATDVEIARLTGELSRLPGDLVVTRSSQMPFSDELRAQLAAAGKVIHIFADDTVRAYVGAPANAPAGVPVERIFRQHGGDVSLGDQTLLPDYLEQEEPARGGKDGVAHGNGLPIGHGALWPESTVAYEIDASVSNASELAAVRNAISSWNTSLDPSGNQIKVRFVPRYWADNRPYVRFVRGGSGGCGLSHVGRADNIFTNWWSHNINLDCFDQATIHHEMAHTAGLHHEHQRCDRDTYVSVWQPAGVNCERLCGGDAAAYGPYNYLSVMHYPYSNSTSACSIHQISPPPAGGYRGAPWQAGSAAALDTYDVLAINQMYTNKPSLPRIGAGIYYSLVPQFTTKVFGVASGSTANGASVVLYDRFAGFWDQHWSIRNTGSGYVELHPRHSLAKCMENLNFVLGNGGNVGQWDCWGGDNQQWILAPSAGAPGYYDLINKYSGKSVDVPGWNNTNNTVIQQYDHTNGTNQRIQLSPAY